MSSYDHQTCSNFGTGRPPYVSHGGTVAAPATASAVTHRTSIACANGAIMHRTGTACAFANPQLGPRLEPFNVQHHIHNHTCISMHHCHSGIICERLALPHKTACAGSHTSSMMLDRRAVGCIANRKSGTTQHAKHCHAHSPHACFASRVDYARTGMGLRS
jgi:hypothetical protein